MGTIAAVQSVDIDSAESLRRIATEQFDLIEHEMSAWNSSSTLSQINQRAGHNMPAAVSPHFLKLLNWSLQMHDYSEGAFNPLMTPVLRLWGFGNVDTPPTQPATNALQAAAALTRCSDIRVLTHDTTTMIELTKPGMALDFGAIAKGYAVDLAWQIAREQNISNALIDLGGNLRALGEARPGRGGWLTGIKDPFNADRLIAKVLLRDGEAIATSGNYERFVTINGKQYAHIIDGRNATPVSGMAAVTVIAPDAVTADALSTALFILDIEKGRKLIRTNFPESLALWIPARQPADIIATEQMRQRLQPL